MRRGWAVAVLVSVLLIFIWIGLRLRRETRAGASTRSAGAAERVPARAPRPIHLSDGRAQVDQAPGVPFSLEGRVLSTRDGAPISGAFLTFGGGVASETHTDDKGRFIWTATHAGPHQLLSLTAPGFVAFAPELDQSPVRFDARPGVRISGVTLFLSPLATSSGAEGGTAQRRSEVDAATDESAPRGRVIGLVKDAGGRPVVAFSILALVRRGAIQRGEEQASAFFDVAGRYVFEDLRAGPQCLTAIALGHAASAEQCVDVPAGGEVRIDFQLGRATKISGRVLDRASRRPLEHARVSVESPFGGETLPVPVVASTETDADGRFELAALTSGTRSLFVTADGHHHRMVPGILLDPDRPPAPLEIDLLATEPGEDPRIESAGINAAVRADGDRLIIDAVSPGGGAAEAGLQRGDVLLKVDGVELASLGSMQAGVERLRGAEGSTVLVTIQRPPDEASRDVVVTRRRVVNR